MKYNYRCRLCNEILDNHIECMNHVYTYHFDIMFNEMFEEVEELKEIPYK